MAVLKHIVVVNDAWFPLLGGGQVNAWEISKAIIKQYEEAKITIVTRNFGAWEADSPERMKVIRLGKASTFNNPFGRLGWLIHASWKIVSLNKQEPIDLIHAHAYSGIIVGRIASWILQKPWLITVHGILVRGQSQKSLGALIERWLLYDQRADAVISVSNDYQNGPHVWVIPNAVDWTAFEKVKGEKETKKTMVWIGRMHPMKNLSMFLEILSEEKAWLNDWQLWLIGSGEEMEQLMQLVKSLQLDDVVMFLGEKHGNEKIELLKRADVLILPSKVEGQPLVIMEAAAAQIPVWVTNVGDNRSWVTPQTGWVCEPRKSDMREALKNMLSSSRKKLSEMGVAWYQVVRGKISWEKSGSMTWEVYQQIWRQKHDN